MREKGIELPNDALPTKDYKMQETDWQRTVKEKKSTEFYSKLRDVEDDQLLKEQRLREHSRQFAVAGDKITKSSAAKDMASKYQESL